jgi:S1-C subfamily serine protease
VASNLDLKVNRGAYVFSGDNSAAVVDGSPAAKAGVKEKDIITKVNNITIDDNTSLTGALSKYKPGDKVTLTIIRNGKTITVPVILGNAPQS